MPPDATTVTFDPHVATAIVCLALALFAAVLAFVFALAEDEERRRQ